MRKRLIYLTLLMVQSSLTSLWGGPTALFWTNCTTQIQETGQIGFQLQDYFTVFNRRGQGSMLPTQTGLEFGLWTWHDLSMEAGFDYYGGTDDPFVFNTKIAMKEDKLWDGAPSWSFGIFNLGTKHKRTDLNVLNLVIGHTLPDMIGGNIYVAAYHGNHALGGVKNGFMLGYTRGFCHVYPDDDKDKDDDDEPGVYDLTKDPFDTCKDDDEGYDRWVFLADYCSGKNFIGGGGVALTYFFTENIYVTSGPVFFNSTELNGRWKWSIQVNFDIPFFDVCCW